MKNDYPLIGDHGLIGDLQTAALVATDGSIDWFCVPRFDSPSVFAALLDDQKGGHFRIAPADADVTYKQFYWPATNVLVTRFLAADGAAELTDFMPVLGPVAAADRHGHRWRPAGGDDRLDPFADPCVRMPGCGREQRRPKGQQEQQ